ncbi:MAG: DNA damage-inducible protein D [Candidatus Cloacimonetes bacterium]|nr:DNA damage-inducible protein D [Candidatus Cloacimonadota bacterium]
MEKQIIYRLTANFEDTSHKTVEGIEFWLARELQHLLGYDKWDNFKNVIIKAKISCETSKQEISDHFADVGKTIKMPKGAEKEIDDLMLTRYACYLIAQNGDSRKQEIAFAQTYFAVQTRKAEIIEQKILEYERVQARDKLKKTEKELSKVIFEQTGGNKNFALIRSKGDKALFNHTTQEMKNKWRIKNKPLADFMPTILLKGKDFATEITIYNAKEKRMNKENQISKEHITNNQSVRKILISRGITPEQLPPEKDVKKVERKLQSEKKKSIKNDYTFNKYKKDKK